MADNHDMVDVHMTQLVDNLGKLAACIDFLPATHLKERATNLLRNCRSETDGLINTYYQDKFTQIFCNGRHNMAAALSGVKENDNEV